MNCEYLSACPFYNDRMPMDRGIGLIYKKKYCLGNQEFCARYVVMNELGQSHVSDALYPNMLDMARQIIKNANDRDR